MARTKRNPENGWKKGGGGFGPKPAGAGGAAGARGPTGITAQERSRQEIFRYQRDGGYLIPKLAFWRLTREVFNKVTKGSTVDRMERSAIEGLQVMAETHLALRLNSKLFLQFT